MSDVFVGLFVLGSAEGRSEIDVLIPRLVFISLGPIGVQGNKIYWRTESCFSVS